MGILILYLFACFLFFLRKIPLKLLQFPRVRGGMWRLSNNHRSSGVWELRWLYFPQQNIREVFKCQCFCQKRDDSPEMELLVPSPLPPHGDWVTVRLSQKWQWEPVDGEWSAWETPDIPEGRRLCKEQPTFCCLEHPSSWSPQPRKVSHYVPLLRAPSRLLGGCCPIQIDLCLSRLLEILMGLGLASNTSWSFYL